MIGGEVERRRRYGECLGEVERMRMGKCKREEDYTRE